MNVNFFEALLWVLKSNFHLLQISVIISIIYILTEILVEFQQKVHFNCIIKMLLYQKITMFLAIGLCSTIDAYFIETGNLFYTYILLHYISLEISLCFKNITKLYY